MKVPDIFIPEKKESLEEKTEDLLQHTNREVFVDNYDKIMYTNGNTGYRLGYEKLENGFGWVLSEKKLYTTDWRQHFDLNDTSIAVLSMLLKPLVKLLNLKEESFYLKEDNVKRILDEFAVKISEEPNEMEEEIYKPYKAKRYGPYKITSYKKENMLIRLKEFESLHLPEQTVLKEISVYKISKSKEQR